MNPIHINRTLLILPQAQVSHFKMLWVQKQPQSKHCRCQKKSAVTDQNKDESRGFAGSDSESNISTRHSGILIEDMLPRLCESRPQLSSNQPPSREQARRRAASCISMQTRRVGLSAQRAVSFSLSLSGWHPSAPASSTLVSIYFHKRRSGGAVTVLEKASLTFLLHMHRTLEGSSSGSLLHY